MFKLNAMFVREAFETRLGREERDRTWFLPTKKNSSSGLTWRLELLTAVKCCLNLKNAIDYNFLTIQMKMDIQKFVPLLE